MLLEICVDSILSAKNASSSGADRIELCSALSEGGLTPNLGLFLGVRRALQNSRTKIYCMIRIRRGNFVYSDEEVEGMIEDINYFKQNGCDGIVFGCLNSENQIDKKNCRKVLNAWGSSPVTFHRAFDETSKDDIEENLKILVDLGFNRILSSGYEPSAEQGIRNLKKMVQLSKNMPIEILSGSGINSLNVKKIIEETGCSEIHCSARSELNDSKTGKLQMGGSQDSQPLMVCDPLKVYEIIQILKTF